MSSSEWVYKSAAADAFTEAVMSDPAGSLMVFDFDGTLSRIVPNPADARMLDQAAQGLARLSSLGVRIALISGRPLDALLELSDASNREGLAKALIFGQYGAEHLDMATGERTSVATPSAVSLAKTELSQILSAYPGASIEEKGLSIAAHFRNTENPEVDLLDAQDALQGVAEKYGLVIEPGRLVMDLRVGATTKGDALKQLVRRFSPSSVSFAGDDLGDVAAFEAIREIEDHSGGPLGCSIVSASAETPELVRFADILCQGPDGVAAWLNHLADRINSSRRN